MLPPATRTRSASSTTPWRRECSATCAPAGSRTPRGSPARCFSASIHGCGSSTAALPGLRTLVFSIAHARVVDEARLRARRPVSHSYDPEYDDRTSDSAEHLAVASLEAERALALMGQLNDDQRTVVSLRIIGDLSLQQTADVTGKTVPAVKQLQRRGLARLRELMASQEVAR